jgi:hypothetical protein
VHAGTGGFDRDGNGHIDHVGLVNRFHAQIVKAQHFTVQELNSPQGLIVGRCWHLALSRHPAQKRFELTRPLVA